MAKAKTQRHKGQQRGDSTNTEQSQVGCINWGAGLKLVGCVETHHEESWDNGLNSVPWETWSPEVLQTVFSIVGEFQEDSGRKLNKKRASRDTCMMRSLAWMCRGWRRPELVSAPEMQTGSIRRWHKRDLATVWMSGDLMKNEREALSWKPGWTSECRMDTNLGMGWVTMTTGHSDKK